MKIFLVPSLFLLILGCGGVVGNLRMDTFDCDSIAFQECINNMFNSKLLFKPDSLSIYRDDADSKIALVLFNKDTFAFSYEISRVMNRKNSTMFVVTNFGKNGDVLEFNKNLTTIKKETFGEIYSDILLPSFKKCNFHPIY